MPSVPDPRPTDPELAAEQVHVTRLYRRLDALRERSAGRLRDVLATRPATHQAVGEREAEAQLHTERIAALDAAESGLVFGRLDRRDSDRPRYVGRVGLSAEQPEDEPLLVDWRAPASRPFYTATPFADEGVVRRRHIRTHLRSVVEVSDEILDANDPRATTSSSGLTGEATLLAALKATRTGRMTDIVRTIQAEQDRIIRSDLDGVLVVQGGPGTGKTAVALHRAAYLLYTHRERLARRGLLVVGPNRTFLRYIADVLPGLGETGVVLADLGGLRPGTDARGPERPEVAEVKGRLAMAGVLARAVRNRQVVPRRPVELRIDGVPVTVTSADATRARSAARSASPLHNTARETFARQMVDTVARRYAEGIGADPLGGPTLFDRSDRDAIREEVAAQPAVRDLIEQLWPRLTAEQALSDLLASRRQVGAATRGWSDPDRELLLRPPSSPWTVADVPLLDELDELLGPVEEPSTEAARRRRQREVRAAQETLDLLRGSRSTDLEEDEDGELLTAGDLLDADRLADRQAVADTRTTAERAAADRTWTYGHVVVDEAQELSPMAWRLVLRRCPTRSMTVVGDVAQTGSLAGASSWAATLAPQLGDRWRVAELTVNYRTPAEIMAVAAEVLAWSGAAAAAPRSVRSTGIAPWSRRVDEGALPRCVADAAAELAAHGGTVAVLVPRSRLAAVRAAVRERLGADPSAADESGDDGIDLTGSVVVLPPHGAKGLEFDSVVVADPLGVVEEGVRGVNDLYVALTRATQRLGVVHPGDLPAQLRGLAARD